MSEVAYLELVDLTGRQLHPGKRGRLQAATPIVLKQIRLSEAQWLIQVRGIESRYWRRLARTIGCATWAEMGARHRRC